jgi:tRNA (guanine-N7-)-methyltransferase
LLADIQRTLVDGGELHFWTDVQEYFESSLELISQHTTFTGPVDVPEPAADHDLDYRTHFERRMRMHGEPVYRSLFIKQ